VDGFVFDQGQLTESALSATAVVGPFDPVDDGQAQLIASGPPAAVEHVFLQGTFDRFECAAQAMAPSCAHCGCRILGHGVEVSGTIYCCAHCAERASAQGVSDRA
jgi:hypothetical protein